MIDDRPLLLNLLRNPYCTKLCCKHIEILICGLCSVYEYILNLSLYVSSLKLSDFGLAVMDGAQNRNNIKLSGTLGYVAPEYLLDGIAT